MKVNILYSSWFSGLTTVLGVLFSSVASVIKTHIACPCCMPKYILLLNVLGIPMSYYSYILPPVYTLLYLTSLGYLYVQSRCVTGVYYSLYINTFCMVLISIAHYMALNAIFSNILIGVIILSFTYHQASDVAETQTESMLSTPLNFWMGVRVAEGARLERVYTSQAYRGFESLSIRFVVLK